MAARKFFGSTIIQFKSCHKCGNLAREQTARQDYICLAACDGDGCPRVIGNTPATPRWCPVDEDANVMLGVGNEYRK